MISYPSGQPDQLLPGSPTTFQLGITALGSTTISPATETLRLSVNGAPASSIALANLGGGDYSATIPALDCFDNASYWIEVGTNGGPITDPPSAPGQTFVADVFTSVDMVFNDDFEADLGWSVGAPGDDATTGIWERVDPIGTAAQPEDDASDPSTIAFVTGQGSPGGGLGENDVDGGQTTLTSPTLDLSGGDAVISYERWYSNDTSATPNTDIFVIDVTNNGGGSWTNVETIGPAGPGTSGGWIHHEFTVSDFVTPTANVQVRFIASDEGDGSLVEAGIDDFDVFRLECGAVCQTDLGFGGPGDLSLSICGALGTGDVATLEVQNAGAFETVYHFLGFANAPVPFKGGTLVPGTFSAIVRVNANASGSLSVPVPGGGGPFSLFVQAAALDGSSPSGVELSNAVQAEFLP